MAGSAINIKANAQEVINLKRRIDELRASLAGMKRESDPKAYDRLNNELFYTTKRVNELQLNIQKYTSQQNIANQATQTTTSGLGALNTGIAKIGGVILAVGAAIAKLTSVAMEFAAQGIAMATQAQGVKRAFDGLNDPTLLDGLRKSTKGTINDLELMKAAVQAQNFGIPVQKLGGLLQFAQQRAADTGQSVDYLVDSIVTGLGRKSIKILDNLQINVAELQKRAKKTGDFMGTAIDMINEKLKEQGNYVLSAADKEQIAAAKRENAQLKVGNALLGIRVIWNEIVASAFDSIGALAERYLPLLVKRIEVVVNKFIYWYNTSETLRAAIGGVYVIFTAVFANIKKDVKIAIDAMGAFADVMSNIGSPAKALEAYNNFIKNFAQNTAQATLEVSKSINEAKQLAGKKMGHVSLEYTIGSSKYTPGLENTKEEDPKGEKRAQRMRDAALKLLNLQAELDSESAKQQLEYEQKMLDIEDDSFDKRYRQNQLNMAKELISIKEFRQKMIKDQQEAAKNIYIKNNGTDTGFNFATFDKTLLPKELSDAYIQEQINKKTNISFAILLKANKDTLKELTDKYQSYADQRLDIEKKFNKDIDTLIKLREKAQEKGDKEAVNKLNRSIAKATTDKGKDLISFDFERMKEAPEYIRAFEDLGTTSTETLNSLLGQFEKFKEEAAKTLSPKDLREYTATIQSIADELSNRDLYGSLIKQKDEAVKANQRLIKAENDLRLVKLGIGDPLLTEEEAIKRVNKAKDEYYNKNKKVLDTQKKIRDQVSALAKEMSGLGNALGGTSGEIISFIGDITSFYTTASEGIEKVAQTGAQAISVVEKASVILTIISTAIQLMKQLNSILPDAFSQYEKYDEKIERINDMRDAVNEYEIAVLKARQAENSWFGNDSLRNLKDYKELQTKIFESYRDKMLEEQAIYENKGSGGWLTNTFKSAVSWVSKITFGFDLLNKKYKEGTTAAVNNLRIETRKKSSGFLGSGIGGKSQKTEDLQTWINNNKDLFKKGLDTQLFGADGMLNQELAGVILEKYGDKLVGQTKETLEELKTLTEQYNEFRAQLREYVNSLYEPLVDNMVSSIWDWFDEGKNALDSFKDYAKETFRDIVSDMIKTILLKDVFKDFKDNIAKLYEEYSKGNLTEAQLSEAVAKETNSVMDRYKTQLPAIQGMVDSINQNIKDATGIDLKNTDKSKGSSQTPSSGYSVSMSQDTGDKLVGIETGSQMRLISLDQNVARIAQWNQPVSEKFNFDTIAMPLGVLSQSSLRIERMMEENRNIAINSYYELKDINKNTKELYAIRDGIEGIKRNTDEM
ncbi:hypothetical protein [Dysgonomonas mossii]|uniref:Uncharacterized protein n=1 Tax=Dysgonomonas mossii DSM 22836 TaxID=742767 RepID=F8X502_9BACT|nr:hypothetical protein [Dysgonomonas mossii]EGK04700.1 hypothetical protein HMPREF9456_03311 [Dysgonomonas mossii DSM 22836]